MNKTILFPFLIFQLLMNCMTDLYIPHLTTLSCKFYYIYAEYVNYINKLKWNILYY